MVLQSLAKLLQSLLAGLQPQSAPVTPPDRDALPLPGSAEDQPVSFGWKTCWIAVQTSDARALAESLDLERIELASWEYGLQMAYLRKGVFLTPPVKGWTLAVGIEPGAEGERLVPLLEALSRRWGFVYYFGTQRVVEHQAWAIARDGAIERAFAWVGDQGRFPINIGDRTPDEIELATGIEDFDSAPDEEIVVQLAARWTVDPTTLEEHEEPRGPGLLGYYPQ